MTAPVATDTMGVGGGGGGGVQGGGAEVSGGGGCWFVGWLLLDVSITTNIRLLGLETLIVVGKSFNNMSTG